MDFTKKQQQLLKKIEHAEAQLEKIKSKKLGVISKLAEKHGLHYLDDEDIERSFKKISSEFNPV